MSHKIIRKFLSKHFPFLESVILFGSYIDTPSTANDIDLLLIDNKFSYSSKESFVFEGMKYNCIKFNTNEVTSILAKHYQQGDFYRVVFEKGIIISDKNKELHSIKKYVKKCYPKQKQDILAFALNDILFNITEYQTFLKPSNSSIEFFLITSKIISLLIDYFLVTDKVIHLKSEKAKSNYFNSFYLVESQKLNKLLTSIYKNNLKKFLCELQLLSDEYNIPINKKYSSDLIFDDYSQNKLILFVETVFSFQEIKETTYAIKKIKPNTSLYSYQIDEDNEEKKGCYFIFDNSNLEIEKEKMKLEKLFKNLFPNYNFTFPYNNIFCFPEIKFMGRKNEETVNNLLTYCSNITIETNLSKEILFYNFINTYLSKTSLKIESLYNYYLGKLNSKTRSSNFFVQDYQKIENKILIANETNETKLIKIFDNIKLLELEFDVITTKSIWLHFLTIDLLISIFLKNDIEKFFYIHCLKKSIHV